MSNLALELEFTAPTAPLLLKGDKWDTWATDIQNDGTMTYEGDDQPVSMATLITSAVEGFYQAIVNGHTLQINCSFGKDSSTCLHLALLALVRAKRQGITQSEHHFVVHSDTGIENPVIRNLADRNLKKLADFVEREDLPLSIVVARPGYASSWPGRVIGGRGLPSTVNSSSRQCTHELKVQPINKAVRHYLKDAPKSIKSNIVMVLGSRDDESHARSKNITKRAGVSSQVVSVNGKYEYYPIRAWSEENVWEFLMSVGATERYVLPSYMPNMRETAETYKDASGECIWSPSGKKQGSACGSRFGCSLCLISVEDKSMTNLLEGNPEKYGHMAGLNRLQRYLIKIQWDWSKRHCVGRTLYTGGFIRIQPDVFGPELTARLLHVCCSLDYQEYHRAVAVEQAIERGELDDNEYNRDMAKPQFRLITVETLMFIEWLWALHHFQSKPFQAMAIYRKVWIEGELDLLEDEPDMEAVPRTPQPAPYWAKVESWYDSGTVFGALSDPVAEMATFEPEQDVDFKVINTKVGKRRVVNFSEESEITVNREAALFVLCEDYPRLREAIDGGTYTPSYAATYLLRLGAISLARGMVSKSDEMMARGQRYHELKLTGALTMDDITQRTDLTILPNAAYQRLAGRRLKANVKKLTWWCRLHWFFVYHQAYQTALWREVETILHAEDYSGAMKDYGAYRQQCENAISMLLSAVASRRLKIDSPYTARVRRRYAMDLLQRKVQQLPPEIRGGLLRKVSSVCLTGSLNWDDADEWKNKRPYQYERYCAALAAWLRASTPSMSGVETKRREEQISIKF